jgi:hypothetical protein
MTDQELIISTLREAGQIICEYLEPGPRDADETIRQLIAVLDTQDLALAIAHADDHNNRHGVDAAGEVVILGLVRDPQPEFAMN